MAERTIAMAQPLLFQEEHEAVLEVLRSGHLASGPKVKAFEEAFAAFVGCQYGIATSNGTTALAVALQGAGLRPGDKVITTPFTFIATANAIVHVGAVPVFADIDSQTYNIDPAAIEESLRRNPDAKGLLIVHLYGQACNMTPILRIVREHGLILIEDCAQAHGATFNGQPVGSFGHAATFSFYATKNMTTGEGGMVTTSQPAVADRVRKLVNHGRVGQYLHDEVGYNHRLTDMAAAIGLVQLGRLPGFNQRRQANAAFLSRHLEWVPHLQTPLVAPGATHVYHQYTVRSPQRDALQGWLGTRGVGSSIVYPVPVHLQPAYRPLVGPVSLPESERAANEVLSLPVHPGLSESDLQRIVQAMREFGGQAVSGVKTEV